MSEKLIDTVDLNEGLLQMLQPFLRRGARLLSCRWQGQAGSDAERRELSSVRVQPSLKWKVHMCWHVHLQLPFSSQVSSGSVF